MENINCGVNVYHPLLPYQQRSFTSHRSPFPFASWCDCRDTRHSGIAGSWRSTGHRGMGTGRPATALHPWAPGRPQVHPTRQAIHPWAPSRPQARDLSVSVPRRPWATLTSRRTWSGTPTDCRKGCTCPGPGNRRRWPAGSSEWRC